MMNSSRGRRSGKPDTRSHILAVARKRFLNGGYRPVTLRSVAADAGVDVALISYHFGSKRGLFAAALDLSANPADIVRSLLEGNLETLAPRALRAMVTTWDHPDTGRLLQAAFSGAAADPALAEAVRGAIQAEMIDQIAARLGGRDARLRAGAFTSQAAGLILTRYILRLEPMASMSVDEIVRRLGPAMSQTLIGPVRHGAARAATR